MAASVDEYKNLLTDLLKKQMVMLGPNVALSTVRKVGGITVSDDGVVTEIAGDPHIAMQQVADSFMKLSGQIAQMTLKTILEKYPGVESPAPQGVTE